MRQLVEQELPRAIERETRKLSVLAAMVRTDQLRREEQRARAERE
jgi:hypothetical protein